MKKSAKNMDFDKAAFDLDGVLAAKPPERGKKWGKMNGDERQKWRDFLLRWYSQASVLIRPKKENFIVITARKNNPEVIEATNAWFKESFGFIPTIFFLDGARTTENVIKFKAKILEENGINLYFEDNLAILKGLKKLLPTLQYFFVDSEQNVKRV